MANNYIRGQSDTRPWGTWEVIDCGDNFCVKHICVNSGGILSLQSHNFRAEHWIIVKGQAQVTLDDKIITKNSGENVYIPVGSKHRIQNNGAQVLEFVEVQVGDNLDENDIIRYEDKYGRVK